MNYVTIPGHPDQTSKSINLFLKIQTPLIKPLSYYQRLLERSHGIAYSHTPNMPCHCSARALLVIGEKSLMHLDVRGKMMRLREGRGQLNKKRETERSYTKHWQYIMSYP
jgi:hypothetical protein